MTAGPSAWELRFSASRLKLATEAHICNLALRRLRQDCYNPEVGLGYIVSQGCECDSLFHNKSNKKKHHSSRPLAQQAPAQAPEAPIL